MGKKSLSSFVKNVVKDSFTKMVFESTIIINTRICSCGTVPNADRDFISNRTSQSTKQRVQTLTDQINLKEDFLTTKQ